MSWATLFATWCVVIGWVAGWLTQQPPIGTAAVAITVTAWTVWKGRRRAPQSDGRGME